MDNPYQPPNPAAAVPAPALDPARARLQRSQAPRWLAVLLALLVGQGLLGVGQLILGRRRLAAVWLALGLGLWLLIVVSVRANVPVLLLAALPCVVVAWIGSVISAGLTTQGKVVTTGRAMALGVAVFLLSLAMAAGQRRYLTEAFQMPAGSMMPALLVGDHFFVAKGSQAEAADVIVFKYPMDPEVDYVKRVVARGGDTIEVRQDVVFVNGQPLPQTRLAEPCPPPPGEPGPGWSSCVLSEERNGGRRYRVQHEAGSLSFAPRTVPAGHLFVMGDNRHNSNDSRVWGTVPVDHVRGRVRFIWWSSHGGEVRWDRIGRLVD